MIAGDVLEEGVEVDDGGVVVGVVTVDVGDGDVVGVVAMNHLMRLRNAFGMSGFVNASASWRCVSI